MRVLTKVDIKKLGDQLLDPFDGDECLTTVGYDLRIGKEMFLLNSGKRIKLGKGESTEIPPRERFSIESLEKVKMKENMFALIATRIGLLWEGLTSLGTKIDPMFQDNLTLVFSNESDIPLKLEYGQRICNAIFFEYENPPEDIEKRVRPSFPPLPILSGIEEKASIEDVQRKYGVPIASIVRYVRPRLFDHEKRLKGLEKFRTGITSLAIAAISTFIVSLVLWLITHHT